MIRKYKLADSKNATIPNNEGPSNKAYLTIRAVW